MQVAELNAKVQELEAQFNLAVEDKEAAIKESERCQLKLQLANRLINALASEGAHVADVAFNDRAGKVLTIHSFIHSSIHSFIHSFIHPSIHSSIHPSIHSPTLPHLLTFHYSLTC
jgi:hypothetical protein